MQVNKKEFGTLKDGRSVDLYTLSNQNVVVKITNYGCIITSIEIPDINGNIENIVCGFDRLEDYLSDDYLNNYPYFGCILGRAANRIAKGKYSIDGVEYSGVVNNGENHLHGGAEGFDKKIWNAEVVETSNAVGVKLSYTSPDGEEGYPGTLNLNCLYLLDDAGKLHIEYDAKTNKKTILNISNHSYFNLTAGKSDVLRHELKLSANKYTESVDMIPTGNIVSVKDTAFDFTEKKALGKDIPELPNGYDLNYVLDNSNKELIYAGCLSEPTTKRSVKVYTTQPGMQLYTGFWIPELEINGKKKFGKYSGVALETQHYPDSVNHPNFPSVELAPDCNFKESTIYEFGLSN